MLKWLRGKKTYIVAAVAFVMAGLPAAGITIPVWVVPLLGALGLGTLRAGVGKNGN